MEFKKKLRPGNLNYWIGWYDWWRYCRELDLMEEIIVMKKWWTPILFLFRESQHAVADQRDYVIRDGCNCLPVPQQCHRRSNSDYGSSSHAQFVKLTHSVRPTGTFRKYNISKKWENRLHLASFWCFLHNFENNFDFEFKKKNNKLQLPEAPKHCKPCYSNRTINL